LLQELNKITSIPIEDQILLSEKGKLNKGNLLEKYELPSKDKYLFLFDRRSTTELNLTIESSFANIDSKVSMSKLGESSLTNYETLFFREFKFVDSVKEIIQKRLEICRNTLSEQSIQMKGMELLKINLNEQYSQIIERYNKFLSHYHELYNKHEALLQSFESDIQRLREIQLHPLLRTRSTSFLIDFVPEVKLRGWFEECGKEHGQLKNKVLELEKQIFAVKSSVETENLRSIVIDSSLPEKIKKIQEIFSDINARHEIFKNDSRSVKNLQPNSLREVANVHANSISKVTEYEELTREILSHFIKSKNISTHFVQEILRNISPLHSKMRDLSNKIFLYNEALLKQEEAFLQLVYVQSMPTCYKASLEEVVRRKKFGRIINNFIARQNTTLLKLREEEITQRQTFLRNYGKYLPKDLIPGLLDAVPRFEISPPPFDIYLPPLELPENVEEDFAILTSNKTLELEKPAYELKSLTPDLSKIQTNLEESQKSIEEYKKRIQSLEENLKNSFSQSEKFENSLEDIKKISRKQIEDLSEQLERTKMEAKENLKVCEDKCSFLEKQKEDLSEQLERTRMEAKENLKVCENKCSFLEKQKEELETKVKENGNQNGLLSNKLKETQCLLETKIEEYEKSIFELNNNSKKKIENLSEELKQLREQFESKKKEAKETQSILETKIKEHENCIFELKKIQDELKKNLEDKEKKVNLLEQKRNEDLKKIQYLTASLEDINNNSKKQIENLSEELKQLKEQFESKKKEAQEQIETTEKFISKILKGDKFSEDPSSSIEKKLMPLVKFYEEQKELFNLLDEIHNFKNFTELSKKLIRPKITIKGFKPGDYALFLRREDSQRQIQYEALNSGCPNYFLSPETLENLEREKEPNEEIFGQIIEISEKKEKSYFEVTICKEVIVIITNLIK